MACLLLNIRVDKKNFFYFFLNNKPRTRLEMAKNTIQLNKTR
jgi:hypothetical protein